MNKLIFNNKALEHPVDKNLFVLKKVSGVYIPSSCYKAGTCKECVIKIEKGAENLNERTINEKHLQPPFRLACQTKIVKDNSTVVCSTLKRDEIIIEENSYLVKENNKVYNINPSVIKTKNGDIFLDGKLIDNTINPVLGLAIDIGTTTVVIRLIEIEKGNIKKIISFENPQRFAGTNVMSRILFDTENRGKQLKRILISYISDAIKTLTDNPENIYEVIVGGNTTMRDIFFGLNVKSIGQSPYISLNEIDYLNGKLDTTILISTAEKMQLPIHPKAKIHSLPIIGNHIGSDVTAGLIATDFHLNKYNSIFIDIGTNTEIIIGNSNRAYAASSPSGPAFEGGGITFGMPALRGAIETIKIEDDNVKYSVIGNKKPVGICGSGLIDVLGELKRTGRINSTGRFIDDTDSFYIDKRNDVFISENDINQLAQAKGSNSGALRVLLNKLDVGFENIDNIYIAGGFGKHIDLDMAKTIGLLPNIDNSKFKRIGNSCIEGLTIALLDKEKRSAITEYIRNIKTVNLESEAEFFDYFVDGCLFIPMNEVHEEDDDF